MLAWLFIGLGLGVLLAVPIAGLWSRRVERKVLASERRAQRAERLAELGTMTGGLAHEIKNPLSTVGLNVQLLQEDITDARKRAEDSDDAELADNLGRVARRLEGLHRETHRLRDILEDFLRFAGRLQLDRQPTDLHRLLEELADFFAPQADDAGIRLRLDLQADPPIADADAALLKQAILNLMLNAVQAMQQARNAKPVPKHGGCDELHLRTSNTSAAPSISQGAAPNAALCIHITDTGPGIPANVLPRIFEPYFSNKAPGSGSGTGLGLPTTNRIIEEHGGQLTVHTEMGQGTAFTITLPQ